MDFIIKRFKELVVINSNWYKKKYITRNDEQYYEVVKQILLCIIYITRSIIQSVLSIQSNKQHNSKTNKQVNKQTNCQTRPITIKQPHNNNKQSFEQQENTVINLPQMVQVIQLHPFKDSYPFGLQKQGEYTFVQLTRQVSSQVELQTYRQNLALFKSIECQQVIKLDSYVKENSNLQLYYEYEPVSIKMFIEDRLLGMAEGGQRERFLGRVIADINASIEEIIAILTSKKILALLSIENIGVSPHQKIKFFIEPDFDHLQKATPTQLSQYYSTQRKKLQIQLQQFLQHIFSSTTSLPSSKDQKKANFVIQGTKLVFVNGEDETNRQSSMSGFNLTGGQQQRGMPDKPPQYMMRDPEFQAVNPNNSSKQKFDIKNILDEKKLQKNQTQCSSHLTMALNGATANNNNSNNMNSSNKDFPSNNSAGGSTTIPCDKPHTRRSFADSNRDQFRKQREKDDYNDTDTNNKEVRNYFQNNDDFNKDASFYPEEFIKEDSIAEFDGYEDQLEKELQDLKKKKYEAEQQGNTSKNRLSMLPNTPITPSQQKMSKTPTPSQHYHQPSSSTTKPFPQQSTSLKYPNNPSPSSYQQHPNFLNYSQNSQQHDTSTDQKQKKKYKVTITTSHEVDVDDGEFDLKEIQKEIIEDIKRGKLRANGENGNGDRQQQSQHNQQQNQQNQQQASNLSKSTSQRQSAFTTSNLPIHLLKGHTRQTHNPSSSHDLYNPSSIPPPNHPQKPTSLNSIHSNLSQEYEQVDNRPFSKQHPHVVSDNGQYVYSAGNKEKDGVTYASGMFAGGYVGSSVVGNSSNVYQGQQQSHGQPHQPHHTHDIKKIIEKIKNNSSHNHNHSQHNNSTTSNNSANNNNNPITSTNFTNPTPNTTPPPTIPTQKPVYYPQEDSRPHSQLSSQGVTKDQGNSDAKNLQQFDKDYHDKILKAKMKAEEIMKLVKERKAQ